MKAIDLRLARRVYKELFEGPLPVVSTSDRTGLKDIVDRLDTDLQTRNYMPSVIHGYYGVEKSHGVTRFLPILTGEDMLVYYHLCRTVAEGVLLTRPGIFGGWRSVPKSQSIGEIRRFLEEEGLAELSAGSYLRAKLGSSVWWHEFRSFTKLIDDLTKARGFGNYVIQSDISNFYDSIEVSTLSRRLRRESRVEEDVIEALEAFLGLWNRRTLGYGISTKGIPQEILSDASRVLSHYYLQRFDGAMIDYCVRRNLRFTRWADDILIFGPSEKELVEAIHHASRQLLREGLNLNSGKTKIYTRADFRRYRAISFLNCIDKSDRSGMLRELRKLNPTGRIVPHRADTVFRALLGFTGRHPLRVGSEERAHFISIARTNPEIVRSLGGKQMAQFVMVADDPRLMFRILLKIVLGAPYASSRAAFLQMVRDSARRLISAGITRAQLVRAIDSIETDDGESELLHRFAIPRARAGV